MSVQYLPSNLVENESRKHIHQDLIIFATCTSCLGCVPETGILQWPLHDQVAALIQLRTGFVWTWMIKMVFLWWPVWCHAATSNVIGIGMLFRLPGNLKFHEGLILHEILHATHGAKNTFTGLKWAVSASAPTLQIVDLQNHNHCDYTTHYCTCILAKRVWIRSVLCPIHAHFLSQRYPQHQVLGQR